MHRITIKQLAVFVAVAQENSVTHAADRIGLSQAAVSQGLSDIEHLLNRRLFDRVGRRLVLNAEGKALLPHANDILERVTSIEAPENTEHFFLRVGASPTIANYHLSPITNQFLLDKPFGHIHIDIGQSDAITHALLHFDLDAGFIDGKNYHSELLAMPWQEEQLAIIAPKGHPLSKKPITPEVLAKADWILQEHGTGSREVFEQAILDLFHPRIRLEVNSNHAIRRAVLDGLGLACVYPSTVKSELATGELTVLDIPWFDLHHTLYLVVHRQKHLSKPLLALIRQCGISARGLETQLSSHAQ